MHKKHKYNVVDKFNEALKELQLRVNGDDTLRAIERMYGFLLGVTAAMESIDHPRAKEARSSVHELLVPETMRTKAWWASTTLKTLDPLPVPEFTTDDAPF